VRTVIARDRTTFFRAPSVPLMLQHTKFEQQNVVITRCHDSIEFKKGSAVFFNLMTAAQVYFDLFAIRRLTRFPIFRTAIAPLRNGTHQLGAKWFLTIAQPNRDATARM
jgi:hypothetical protein